jgi:predicted esterase YcpF (UPF0227 family)
MQNSFRTITRPDDVPFLQSLGMPSRWDIPKIRERVLNPAVEGQRSLRYPLGRTSQHIRLPFWVLEFWDEAHKVMYAKQHWHSAILWLKEHRRQDIPWDYQTSVAMLSSFAPRAGSVVHICQWIC